MTGQTHDNITSFSQNRVGQVMWWIWCIECTIALSCAQTLLLCLHHHLGIQMEWHYINHPCLWLIHSPGNSPPHTLLTHSLHPSHPLLTQFCLAWKQDCCSFFGSDILTEGGCPAPDGIHLTRALMKTCLSSEKVPWVFSSVIALSVSMQKWVCLSAQCRAPFYHLSSLAVWFMAHTS